MNSVSVDNTTYFGHGITDLKTFAGPVQTSKLYSNGEIVTYTGDFVNGLKHGNGTLSSAKGTAPYFFTSITGQWNKDILTGPYTRSYSTEFTNWIVTGIAVNGVQEGEYHLKYHNFNKGFKYDCEIDGHVTDISEKKLFIETYPKFEDKPLDTWHFNKVRVFFHKSIDKPKQYQYQLNVEMILSVKDNIIEQITLPDGSTNNEVIPFSIPLTYPLDNFINKLIEMLGGNNIPLVFKENNHVVSHQLKNNGTFYYPESTLPMFKGVLQSGMPNGEGHIFLEDGTIIKGNLKPKAGSTIPLTLDKMDLDAPMHVPLHYNDGRVRYDGQCIYSTSGEAFQVGRLEKFNDLFTKEEEIRKYLEMQSRLNPGTYIPSGTKRSRRDEPVSFAPTGGFSSNQIAPPNFVVNSSVNSSSSSSSSSSSAI